MKEKPSEVHPKKLDVKTVTITAGNSLSAPIDLGAGTPVAIEMPASWDAANLTFKESADGAAFKDYYDTDGTEVTVTAASSRAIRLDASKFAGIGFLQIRSGTSASPVNQTADRTLNLITRVL